MRIIPGLLLALLLAGFSYGIAVLPFWPFTLTGTSAPHPIEPILVAIILGMIVSNIFALPNFTKSGIEIAAKKLLPLGIILLGARLNIFNVMKISAHALVINIICVIVAFVLTLWLCHKIKITQKLGLLIGIGTAICGSTAIVVTAPIIKAQEAETAMAVTLVTLFGLIAIFLYPVLGHLLKLNQWAFGVWSGTAIQAIPQVVAAAFAYGNKAGEIGTVVKLVRILLLAPMIVGLNIWQTRVERNAEGSYKASWTQYLPPFIIAFIGLVIVNSLGWIRDFSVFDYSIHTSSILNFMANFLMAVAMAGLGLSTRLHSFVKMGFRPFVAGFSAAIILGVFSLILIKLFY